MVYFVRSGPEVVVIKFKDKPEAAEETLLKWSFFCGDDPEEAFSLARESFSIVITIAEEAESHSKGIKTYLSENSIAALFCMMLNSGAINEIAWCYVEPGCMIMRLKGNIDNGIRRIRDDFEAEFIDKSPFFRRTLPEDHTIIYFTQDPLNKNIPYKDIYSTALLIKGRTKSELLSALQVREMEYLGDSMGTPDWKSMEIQIGDKDGRFDIHRRRVRTAVEGLQAGMILEEGWSREYTLMGKVVDVYVLKLHTPLSEDEIKGLLCGLEYDETGERVADIDLFIDGKKISWQGKWHNDAVSKIKFALSKREESLNSMDRFSLGCMRELDDELKAASAK